MPLEHGEHLASLVAGCDLSVREEESHLGGLGVANDVIDALLVHWPEISAPTRTEPQPGPARGA